MCLYIYTQYILHFFSRVYGPWCTLYLVVEGKPHFPFFIVGKKHIICLAQLKDLEIMHDFHYYWDFCIESKVIILIISDPSFSLIDLCNAHLSVVRGITFSDRGRIPDGQQMGVLPCLLTQVLAQAETVSDCQFVLTACGCQYCIWYSSHGSE